jgi:hypothetical protein
MRRWSARPTASRPRTRPRRAARLPLPPRLHQRHPPRTKTAREHLRARGPDPASPSRPRHPARRPSREIRPREPRPSSGDRPGRRPGQDEPGQHIGLERQQLTRARRNARLTQVSYDGQAQARASLAFTDPGRPAIDPRQTRETITNPHTDRSSQEAQVQGLQKLLSPQGTLGLFIKMPRATRPSCITVDAGHWCRSKACAGLMRSMLVSQVAVSLCCIASCPERPPRW